MNNAWWLHNEAMLRTELALLARTRNDHNSANKHFSDALELELEAIREMKDTASETMFSLLYRNAAALAVDCGRLRLAEQLVSTALSRDNVPAESLEELISLREQIEKKEEEERCCM